MASKKTYLVTAGVLGQSMHREFMMALKAYAQRVNAQIIVAPIASTGAGPDAILDPAIAKDPALRVIGSTFELHPKLRLVHFFIKAEQINPLTGLDRFVRNGHGPLSAVIPSSKQYFKSVADLSNDPRGLWTTGACTQASYKSNRIGAIADEDHVVGAVIVEAGEDGYFHVRHFRWKESMRCFTDLGRQVTVTGTGAPSRVRFINVRAEALILGDIHSGDTDPVAMESCFRMMRRFAPRVTAVHDLFNGHSINHHERHKSITRALEHRNERLSLETEVNRCAADLLALEAAAPRDGEVLVVASNHNDWLLRYLNEGHYVTEPHNFAIAVAAANAAVNLNMDPLEFLIRNVRTPDCLVGGKAKPRTLRQAFRQRAPFRKVRFLERNQLGGYRVKKFDISQHGDYGVNGGPGSNQTLDNAGRAVIAHRHTPEVFRGVIVVGTNTKLRLGYNSSSTSTWMHADALIYPDGSAQLIIKLTQRGCQWTYLE